ncbi:MAG TPA: response regulator transcription factor [Polyangia bacterium]|nr:response regulator transcription factor [Polyangia bacterium]
MKWTVALVEDQPLFRQGLQVILGLEPDLVVVGAAATGAEARALAAGRPCMMVIDVGLEDVNGIELAKEIMALSPRTHILILTMHTDEAILARAVAAGVAGFALKSQPLDELMGAIRAVARGDTYRPARYAHLAAVG